MLCDGRQVSHSPRPREGPLTNAGCPTNTSGLTSRRLRRRTRSRLWSVVSATVLDRRGTYPSSRPWASPARHRILPLTKGLGTVPRLETGPEGGNVLMSKMSNESSGRWLRRAGWGGDHSPQAARDTGDARQTASPSPAVTYPRRTVRLAPPRCAGSCLQWLSAALHRSLEAGEAL